ncbi:ATP-binding cassette domain-containing protein [Massilia sp. W12]|uniref:ABC transporter ATP-binding protein n=1 Tax=Massilia sp. W12 TaxID=3126507 RepID=UPI0030CFC1CB
MQTAKTILQIENLHTRFGSMVVHRALNLQVFEGEILSIVGGSGSGKTVLLRHMLGLEKPQSGTVKVFDIDLQQASRAQLQYIRQQWGMLFQHGALYSALTVFENVALPLRELRSLPESVIRELVLLKLDMVGLGPEHAAKMPANLSGGMVKRVALARALALDPKLLFLDEPTAGLDPDRSESFVSLIKNLHQHLNLTVVMVTHDLDTLFALSGRIAVLADKQVVASGARADIIQVKHPFIEHFFLGERGLRAQEGLL